MNRLIPIFLGIVFVATISRADLVMKTSFTVGKITNDTIVKIKGDKISLDSFLNGHEAWNRIADIKTGNDFRLLPIENRIVNSSMFSNEMSGYFVRAKWPKFQDAGKAENVNDYASEIYGWTNFDGTTETLWIAKNFPDFQKIRDDFVKLDKLDIMGGLPELSSLSGMPLKLEISRNIINEESTNKLDVLLTLVSAKAETVDASTYNIPTNYHHWYGPQPDGDFFRAMREPPNYSVNLDLNNPTNYMGIPPPKHWFPMGAFEFCDFEGTVTTQIKLPDGKIINEDFHSVEIERDHAGILSIQLDSLGWLKPEKAINHLKRELRDWASDVLSPDQCNEKEAEIHQWLTADRNDQFKGFFVKRPGYTLSFNFVATVNPQNDGFAYRYQIQLREPTRNYHEFPTGISKPQPKQ